MSYIKQIFEKGQTLMAEDLNKMSEGIVSKCEIVEVNELPKEAQPESCYIYHKTYGINSIEGMISVTVINVDTLPEAGIQPDATIWTTYYNASDKKLYIYGDIESNGVETWVDFYAIGVLTEMSFGGYVNSIDEATDDNTYYIIITPPTEAELFDSNVVYKYVESGGDYYWVSDDGNIGKNPSNEELGGAPIIVHNVYNVPEIGKGFLHLDVSSSAFSFLLYYEGSSKSLKAYVDEFSIVYGGVEGLGLSIGWMDAVELANLLGLPLLGAFSDESDLPTDKPEVWLAYIAKDAYRYYIYDKQGRHELISSRNINDHVNPPHLYEHYVSWYPDVSEYSIKFTYLSSESTVPLYNFVETLANQNEYMKIPASGYYFEGLEMSDDGVQHQITEILIENGTAKVLKEDGFYFDLLAAIKEKHLDMVTRSKVRQIY